MAPGTMATASATSNSAKIEVVGALPPVFNAPLASAVYDVGDTAAALDGTVGEMYGTVTYHWQSSTDGATFADIPGATGATYTPDTSAGGVAYYRVTATNIVGEDTASSVSNTAEITVYAASVPVFSAPLVGGTYTAGDTIPALDGTAAAPHGAVTYQWYQDGAAIPDATGATYTPGNMSSLSSDFYVIATNTVGTSSETAQSNTVHITVYAAEPPVFTVQPQGAAYIEYDVPAELYVDASVVRGALSFLWQSSADGDVFADIPGAAGQRYAPPTGTPGVQYYRARAVNTVGASTAEAYSDAAQITVTAAQIPVFRRALTPATYLYAAAAVPLDGTAYVDDGGTVSYQWYRIRADDTEGVAIPGATAAMYTPPTVSVGMTQYYVVATNTLHNSKRSARSNSAAIEVIDTRLSQQQRWTLYLETLRTNTFTKLCRLEFLNPDGSVAFATDNDHRKRRSRAFIQNGTLNVNLQNGIRREVSGLTLSNMDEEFSYNVNHLWFGQQIRLMEGLLLPSGDEFLLPQGVFYIRDPQDVWNPSQKTVTLDLVDKWAYLDGTLFGNLDGIYEVPVNSPIFTAIDSVLKFDRGNGLPIDGSAPVFTNFYGGKTVTLPDGSVVPVLNTPYTYRCESEDGSYADVLLEMNTMLAGWIGYDQTGRLRLDAGDDDILDTSKAVLWHFSPEEIDFLGASYTVKNTEVYNDIIIEGEALGDEAKARGRATNMDPRSDLNIYGALGRRTKRIQAASHYANEQCNALAEYYLKRYTVLKKSVSISCQQMFHLVENNLVTIVRPDKPGRPVERHLVTGFSRPIAQLGNMTVTATSVNDFPEATVTPLPGA